jgi:23S rRNA pseudouridine2605 synthase
MKQLRLQKFLAQSGIASRRKAETMIGEGRVSIDGVVITEMGVTVDPEKQQVCCDGKPVKPNREPLVYILLHKPRGYVTTMSDPQGRPIVSSLITELDTRVFPVGRLDLDSEGALILTNDGNLAQKITHPRHETTKTYEALVKDRPNLANIRRLQKGIILDGKKTWPARIDLIKRKEHSSLYRITIHEGRKRQIRLMFQEIGHPVLRLKRTAYGKLALGSLKSGSYRFLTLSELKKIFL